MSRYYPLEALVTASGMTEAALARRVGMSGTLLKNARTYGLREEAADRFAIRAGFHPCEVWDDWFAYETDQNTEDDQKILEPEPVLHDLALVDPAWSAAIDAEALLAAVEARLVAAGAVVELRQLRGFSAQETALLVERERQWPSGCPHAVDGTVAA